MKKLVVITVIIFFAGTVHAQNKKEVIRLSEPVQVTDEFEVFGAVLETPERSRSLSEVIEDEGAINKDVVIKATIAEVCEKKGCFFVARDGENSARITFKDYGFFIPTDSEGKEVTIVGTFSKKMLTEEKAKHFAEDAGKDADDIKGEQAEYSIVATSVILYKD